MLVAGAGDQVWSPYSFLDTQTAGYTFPYRHQWLTTVETMRTAPGILYFILRKIAQKKSISYKIKKKKQKKT